MNIHVLNDSLINKIAAGEVIERPASVVKELIENAIDAGASSIGVEIKGGGIDFIKITDNGCGIEGDDIETAFLRHATSKLNTIDDLDSILTLGFRGEALSSIAAVAQVEMLTRTAESDAGTKFSISGGIVQGRDIAAANKGTVITIKNLFFNTPARRKFLKKPAVEGTYVSEAVNRIALGHPDVSIKYTNNGNTILYTSGGGDIREVMLRIYGRDVASQLLPVSGSKDGYTVSGVIAKPSVSRATRSYENFFINGRYIRSTLVQDAVHDACKGRFMVGKFPVFALNLKVPSSTVDVNVHPTKLEVRFSDDNFIYDFIYGEIEKVLSGAKLISSEQWGKNTKEKSEENAKTNTADKSGGMVYSDAPMEKKLYSFRESDAVHTKLSGEKSIKAYDDVKGGADEKTPDTAENKKSAEGNTALEKVTMPAEKTAYDNGAANTDAEVKAYKKEDKTVSEADNKKEETAPPKKIRVKNADIFDKNEPFFSHYKIVGQVFGTYWIIEQDNSLYMIDQHAAHERAIYEELKQKMLNGDAVSQLMLQPAALNLTEQQKLTLEENRELLEKFGFEIEQFGTKMYALRAVPYVFDSPGNVSFFIEILDTLSQKNIKNIYETRLDTIATMSCKAAVKGNNRLSFAEAEALIQKMLKLDNPFSCPHGRPTIIEMTKYELEKKFKRIQD